MRESLDRQVLPLLLGGYLGTEWLGGMVGICLTFKKAAKPFSCIGSHNLTSCGFKFSRVSTCSQEGCCCTLWLTSVLLG